MNYRESFVSVAYNIVVENGKEISFAQLWNAVCEKLEVSSEDKVKYVSYFYTQLTLDGRFVTLGENVWDLRIRHTFDKVHIDMNDIYVEEEEEVLELEDEDVKDDIDRLNSEDEDDYEEDEDEENEDEE